MASALVNLFILAVLCEITYVQRARSFSKKKSNARDRSLQNKPITSFLSSHIEIQVERSDSQT